MQSLRKKREQEQKVLIQMIRLFCKKQHGQANLCPDCQCLLLYALERVRQCPFMESKTFCSQCAVHCYQSEMREKIRAVMRFSGPRMLLYHPILTLHHMVLSLWDRRQK